MSYRAEGRYVVNDDGARVEVQSVGRSIFTPERFAEFVAEAMNEALEAYCATCQRGDPCSDTGEY